MNKNNGCYLFVHFVNCMASSTTRIYRTVPRISSPPPNNKKWLMFKCPYLRNRECFCVTFFIIMYRYHFVSEMLNTFETFEVKEMRTFKHEPFFIVGGGGGGRELIRGTLWY